MYRQRFGRITPRDVVHFLVMDRDFPRSVHYCVGCAAESLHAITGTSPGYFRYRSEQLLGRLEADLNYATTDSVIRGGLHEYLDGLQDRMNAIDRALRSEFTLRRVPGQSQSQTSLDQTGSDGATA